MCPLSRRAQSRLFVAIVSLTILFVALATLYAVRIDPRIHISAHHKFVYISFIALSLFTYFRTHFTSPGSPELWHIHRPDLPHPHSTPPHPAVSDDLEKGSPVENYCARCDAAKPERVHHCSLCDACILRFDHHCPWLGTCIGLLNAKFFLQFLLYTTVAAMHTVFLQVSFLMHCRHAPLRDPNALLFLALITPVVLAVAVASTAGVGGLFLWNFWLAANNQTALENFRSGNGTATSNYSTTLLPNLRHLLGWNVMWWLIPISQSRLPPTKPKM